MDPKPTGIFNNCAGFNMVEHTSLGMSTDAKTERGDSWSTRRICNCCGAYAGASDDDISQPSNGILLALNNTATEEQETDVFTTKHIVSKNGVLTVSVRKKWQ